MPSADTAMKLVSVIIPIYNLDAYLHQCVESVRRQTYVHLEIILVDDGSTDKAPELCEYFRKIDARVTVIRQRNSGLVAARKAGLKESRGEYIFYLDGDDWIDDTCIEEYVSSMTEFHVDIVIGDYKRDFLGVSEIIRNRIEPGYYDRERIERDVLPLMVSHENFFGHGVRTYSWGKLFKRSILFDLQLSVPNSIAIAEDAAVVYPAINNAASIYVSKTALCNYRQRANSILKQSSPFEKEIGDIAIAMRFLRQQLVTSPTDNSFLVQLQKYFVGLALIRSGGFLSAREQYEKYEIFGEITPAARVAIYNSGSFGRQTYLQANAGEFVSISGWYDPDFRESRIIGMEVSEPAVLDPESCDLILVASLDQTVVRDVKALSQSKKIPVENLRFPRVCNEDYASFIVKLGFDPQSFERTNLVDGP